MYLVTLSCNFIYIVVDSHILFVFYLLSFNIPSETLKILIFMKQILLL
jgi:hypothetical protein